MSVNIDTVTDPDWLHTEREAGMVQVFHLQGGHDQQTHAGGRGGHSLPSGAPAITEENGWTFNDHPQWPQWSHQRWGVLDAADVEAGRDSMDMGEFMEVAKLKNGKFIRLSVNSSRFTRTQTTEWGPEGEEVFKPGSIVEAYEVHSPEFWRTVGRRNEIGMIGTYSQRDGSDKGGEIIRVDVDGDWQRQGVATEMWKFAKKHIPNVRHSRALTPDGRAWNDYLDAEGLAVQTFHLQGQHDQQSHAGGRAKRASSIPEPSAEELEWRRSTREVPFLPTSPAGFESKRAVFLNDRWLLVHTEDGTAIRIEGGIKTGTQDRLDMVNALADAYDANPVTALDKWGDKVAPRIEILEEWDQGPSVAAYVMPGLDPAKYDVHGAYWGPGVTGRDPYRIYVNDSPDIWTEDSLTEFRRAAMPEVANHSSRKYIITHEYGHVRMALGDDNRDEVERIGGAVRGRGWMGMSEYGKSNQAESHAEAFTEWTLSGGQTPNQAARLYARDLRWPGAPAFSERIEDPIAASAGVDDYLRQPILCGDGPDGPVYVFADEAAPVEQFHLQGQHDQQSHGRRGGASNVRTLDDTDGIIDGMGASLQDWLVVQSEPGQVGSVSAAKWRADRGMKLTERDQYTMDLMNGEPDALAEYRQSTEEKLSGYAPADDDTVAAVRAAAEYEADNPVFSKMIERYGDIPVIPVQDADGADARYIANAIVIGETTSHSGSAPITFDEFMIDRSMPGTLRHEYGHHVQSRLTVAQSEKWDAAINSWGSMSAGPEDLFKMFNEDAGGAGLSLYARMNSDETFAEAFALVTHRDFDPGRDYGPAQQIVDVMKEIVE